ncbi:DUF6192 family protein [Streptomyces sp. NPDC056704]|uniref:DUF6192 family protein n=1 Tax=Streptomyces sp. NPDC056704 TaxID=3345917 RepID=UPI0036901283
MGAIPTSTKVGSVSRARYEEIIAGDRELVEVDTKIQFVIGDHALEIEPMRPHGGSLPAGGEDLFGVRETLEMYAEDVGVPYNQVRLNRQTASRWPAEYRVQGVSFEIHRILEKLDDRFERITNPPRHPRDGAARWTQDAAKRQVGWRVDSPRSVQEKVEAIHDLAVDEQVAARVATDFLRRPGVAFRAAGDDYPDYGLAAA